MVCILEKAPGLIYIAFDGWQSRNWHALFSITYSFLDCYFKPQKLVLGLPEIQSRHSGENIAAEIIEIIESYRIGHKIGYFTLNNASNNSTAVAAIVKHFDLPTKKNLRWVQCIGHVINLIIKALLFGKSHKAFKDELPAVQALKVASHNLWLKQGPVGKLYNLVI